MTLQKILSVFIALSLLIGCFALTAFAEGADVLVFEGESTPFSVTDSEGKTATVSKESKWAWSLNLGITESKPSGKLTYFRSGGVGGTVDFKVTLDKAASYSLVWAFRPNDTSFSTVQVLVNGTEVGEPVSQKAGDTVGGIVNQQNIIRTVDLGAVAFLAGENTVSFKIVEQGAASNDKSALTVDYFSLTPEVEESGNIRYESETTPFTVTDASGKTTNVNKESAWAWSLGLSGAPAGTSGALTYFRSGGIGGTVDFTLNVEKAGEYGIVWAFRSHNESYSTVQVLVNGAPVGGEISQMAGATVAGAVNGENALRVITLGNATLEAGENTVSFRMVGIREDGDLSKSGFTSDYIELTAPVDESELTFTETVRTLAEGSYYQTRINADDAAKIDLRVLFVIPEEALTTADAITVTLTAISGEDGSEKTLSAENIATVYYQVSASVNGNLDVYAAEEGYVIFGLVITGAPSGTTIGTAEYTVS
ncbi:MAG: hypothetical protein IJW46_02355 [Clostridia bacterium]|nr:hypothetical protein [Clostridia bacterium]